MGIDENSDVRVEKMDTGAVRVHLRLTKRVHDELKMLAEFEGRSVSDVIRQVINSHLRNNQDAIDQMRDGKENGGQE